MCGQVPLIGVPGNHEIEQQYQADGNYTIFESVMARWKVSIASDPADHLIEVTPRPDMQFICHCIPRGGQSMLYTDSEQSQGYQATK